MPHIIVEYSSTLTDFDVQNLLENLHKTLSENGVDIKRIKTRAYKLEGALVGDKAKQGQMLHATLLLLEGRDVKTKQAFGQALHQVMKNAAPQDCAVTLEIRDMAKDTYYM